MASPVPSARATRPRRTHRMFRHATATRLSSMAVRRTRAGIWWWELKIRVGPNLWVVPSAMALLTLGLFGITRHLDSAIEVSAGDRMGWLPEWSTTRYGRRCRRRPDGARRVTGDGPGAGLSTKHPDVSLATTQLGQRLTDGSCATRATAAPSTRSCPRSSARPHPGVGRTGSDETLPQRARSPRRWCGGCELRGARSSTCNASPPRPVTTGGVTGLQDLDRSLEAHRNAHARRREVAGAAEVVARSDAGTIDRRVDPPTAPATSRDRRRRRVAIASRHDAVLERAHRRASPSPATPHSAGCSNRPRLPPGGPWERSSRARCSRASRSVRGAPVARTARTRSTRSSRSHPSARRRGQRHLQRPHVHRLARLRLSASRHAADEAGGRAARAVRCASSSRHCGSETGGPCGVRPDPPGGRRRPGDPRPTAGHGRDLASEIEAPHVPVMARAGRCDPGHRRAERSGPGRHGCGRRPPSALDGPH